MYVDMYLITSGVGRNTRWGNRARMQKCTPFEQKHIGDMTNDGNRCRNAPAMSRRMQGMIGNENETLSMQKRMSSEQKREGGNQRLTRPMCID